MASFATHSLSEFVNTKLLAKRLPHPEQILKIYLENLQVFAYQFFYFMIFDHVLIYVFACDSSISLKDGSLLPTSSFMKPFLFIFCILFEKLGHISPSNLCELQIRPFRPLLLTFMNRKLGGRPNICASVFFINSTDLTHYSFKIQNEIETRPISPSNRILGSLHVLINCWDRD